MREVKKKIIAVGEYRFVPLGAVEHFRPKMKLWIARNSRFFSEEELEFPVQGNLRETKGGNLLLSPGDKWIHLLYIPCGYRGETEFVYSSVPAEGRVFTFPYFESERGSKGISLEVLVVADLEEIILGFSRTGRLYGEPEHLTLIIRGKDMDVLPAPHEEVIELREV